jgi:hypothetical protein
MYVLGFRVVFQSTSYQHYLHKMIVDRFFAQNIFHDNWTKWKLNIVQVINDFLTSSNLVRNICHKFDCVKRKEIFVQTHHTHFCIINWWCTTNNENIVFDLLPHTAVINQTTIFNLDIHVLFCGFFSKENNFGTNRRLNH